MGAGTLRRGWVCHRASPHPHPPFGSGNGGGGSGRSQAGGAPRPLRASSTSGRDASRPGGEALPPPSLGDARFFPGCLPPAWDETKGAGEGAAAAASFAVTSRHCMRLHNNNEICILLLLAGLLALWN